MRATLTAVCAVVLSACTSVSTVDQPSAPTQPNPVDPTSSQPTSAGAAATAIATLATLSVKGRAPMTGYERALFGQAWTDDNDDQFGHNGCDTRNDILRRDLTSVVIKANTNGCVVASGTLHEPYIGVTMQFVRGVGTSSLVQIDHVVALGDAWQKGAQAWSTATRVNFANDPLNLLAVSGVQNEAKGDGDAATWLPPNRGFWCAYVERQIAVKAKYRVWVTRAEHDAMVSVLNRCGSGGIAFMAPPPPQKTSATATTTALRARSGQAARFWLAPRRI